MKATTLETTVTNHLRDLQKADPELDLDRAVDEWLREHRSEAAAGLHDLGVTTLKTRVRKKLRRPRTAREQQPDLPGMPPFCPRYIRVTGPDGQRRTLPIARVTRPDIEGRLADLEKRGESADKEAGALRQLLKDMKASKLTPESTVADLAEKKAAKEANGRGGRKGAGSGS